MTRAEWTEVALIAGISSATILAWPYLPVEVTVSRLILGGAVILLLQSLVRDITVLLRRRSAKLNLPGQVATCMCLESTVSVIGIVVGLLAPAILDLGVVSLSRSGFSFAVAATLAFGLAIKDWVIAWQPLALRREKDHLNVIVRWKR